MRPAISCGSEEQIAAAGINDRRSDTLVDEVLRGGRVRCRAGGDRGSALPAKG
jgi:hypothetical protein